MEVELQVVLSQQIMASNAMSGEGAKVWTVNDSVFSSIQRLARGFKSGSCERFDSHGYGETPRFRKI